MHMRKRILRSEAWSYCSPFFCNSPSCQDPGVVCACPAGFGLKPWLAVWNLAFLCVVLTSVLWGRPHSGC